MMQYATTLASKRKGARFARRRISFGSFWLEKTLRANLLDAAHCMGGARREARAKGVVARRGGWLTGVARGVFRDVVAFATFGLSTTTKIVDKIN